MSKDGSGEPVYDFSIGNPDLEPPKPRVYLESFDKRVAASVCFSVSFTISLHPVLLI